jgi:hypothetical protein
LNQNKKAARNHRLLFFYARFQAARGFLKLNFRHQLREPRAKIRGRQNFLEYSKAFAYTF